MKIVHFNSGLGNQIFQLMFARYMESKGKHVIGYYNKKWLQQHNGLEVNKVIDGKLPPATLISNIIVVFCRFMHRFDQKGVFFSSDYNYNENGVYYSGYWQNKRYFEHLSKPSFRKFNLSERNYKIQQEMRESQSVSIHIRRGDYLSPDVIANMGNICTLEYYKKAIDIVKQKMDSPKFFVFSDDISWARTNFHENNMCFVDWNTGKDSYLDMYLMAQCKAHIIANSSFSFWGAYLSKENFITIYPAKWCNLQESPDIAPLDWISIS